MKNAPNGLEVVGNPSDDTFRQERIKLLSSMLRSAYLKIRSPITFVSVAAWIDAMEAAYTLGAFDALGWTKTIAPDAIKSTGKKKARRRGRR